MKRRLCLLILFCAAAVSPAQSFVGGHGSSLAKTGPGYVLLTWTASTASSYGNPGQVYVYRAVGSCPLDGTIGSLSYVKLTSYAVAGGSYTDRTVSAATTYCYYITAAIPGYSPSESDPSNTTQATTLP